MNTRWLPELADPSVTTTGEGGDWAPCRGERVLVVDDDPDLRELLTGRLRRVGCIVVPIPTGSDALVALRETAVSSIDLVLIDLRMPGLSGLEVLRRVRLELGTIPALLMTAYAADEVRAAALALGIHVIEKPFTFETLRRSMVLLALSRRLKLQREVNPRAAVARTAARY